MQHACVILGTIMSCSYFTRMQLVYLLPIPNAHVHTEIIEFSNPCQGRIIDFKVKIRLQRMRLPGDNHANTSLYLETLNLQRTQRRKN